MSTELVTIAHSFGHLETEKRARTLAFDLEKQPLEDLSTFGRFNTSSQYTSSFITTLSSCC
jgi:hypothetical protein